jgi:hypothetical protein
MSNLPKSDARGNRSTPIIVPQNSTEQLQLSLSVSPARWRAFRDAVDELERKMKEEGLLS